MPRLEATREFEYGGRILRPGDEFDAPNHHAKALRAVRRAKDVTVAAAPVKPMDTGNSEAIVPTRTPRGYRRRDMQAEQYADRQERVEAPVEAAVPAEESVTEPVVQSSAPEPEAE